MKKAFEYKNILQILKERVKYYSDIPFLFEKRDVWHPITYKEVMDSALQFASALTLHGQRLYQTIAVLSANKKEWPISILGTIYSGGIVTGLYPSSSATQCEHMLNHSEAFAIVIDSMEQYKKIESIRGNLKYLKHIIVIDSKFQTNAELGLWNYLDFLKLGKQNLSNYQSDFNLREKYLTLEDSVFYVYTSGTTGDPKAAILTHRYILYSVQSIQEIFLFTPDDKILSYLPYCHVGELIFGFMMSLFAARTVYLVENIAEIFELFHTVQPTVFGGIPRLYEKLYTLLQNHLRSLSPEEFKKIEIARETALKYFSYKLNKQSIPKEIQIEYKIANKESLSSIREKLFGKKMKILTSGAASLAKHIAQDFVSIGIPIYEAYGLTENICISFNRPDMHKINTVGIPMPYTEVVLAADGEILVSGNNRFKGYYKNVEATKEIFDYTKKWIKTGDIGQIDEAGFIQITDRKKELLITSTGKNIAPTPIENSIKRDIIISQAMVVGEAKSYLSALITLNLFEAIKEFESIFQQTILEDDFFKIKSTKYPSEDSWTKISSIPEIKNRIQSTINLVNQNLNNTEQIKKFIILPFDFNIENNEVTPTLKLKRKNITTKYQSMIDALYLE